MASATFTSLIFIGILTCALGQENPNCECVFYYQCLNNGSMNVYGIDIVDEKSNSGSPSVDPCPDVLQVCCSLEDKRIEDTPYVNKGCGYRRTSPINIREWKNDNQLANQEEFPWMIHVATLEKLAGVVIKKNYIGGGSLIHRKVVLTAGHKIKKFNAADLEVRAGEWDRTKDNERLPYQIRSASRIVRHPGLDVHAYKHNFALLILSEPFELTHNIDTICLPESGEEFLNNNCIFTGWGVPGSFYGNYSNILKAIEIPIVPADECQQRLRQTRLGSHFLLHPTLMCAGGTPGFDSCYGDGGSPLVCPMKSDPQRYVQAGVVTWGVNCNTTAPGAYAKVSTARQWIDSELRRWT